MLSVDNYLCRFSEPTYEDCLNLIARTCISKWRFHEFIMNDFRISLLQYNSLVVVPVSTSAISTLPS
jgi:hypothetical protein